MPKLDANLFDERLQKLNRELRYFDPFIGGWPTRIKSASQAQEILKHWNKARVLGEELLNEQPDSVAVKYALGDLLRMGHNMDVPGAAQASEKLLNEVIDADPYSFLAYHALACLYVTISPKLAPDAERHFLHAAEIIAPRILPSIYQGLGFACLYQDKVSEAIDCFEKYLAAEVRKDPDIQKIVADLKHGKKFETVQM